MPKMDVIYPKGALKADARSELPRTPGATAIRSNAVMTAPRPNQRGINSR